MKKIFILINVFLFSCSGPDATAPVTSTYSVELTNTCPNINKSSYCVTKAVHDQVLAEMNNNPNQGCVYTQINTISDGVRKGYILSVGVGCNQSK